MAKSEIIVMTKVKAYLPVKRVHRPFQSSALRLRANLYVSESISSLLMSFVR